MAEAFFNAEMERRGIREVRAISAGTMPSDHANPAVIAAMAKVGIRIPDTPGRQLTPEISRNAIKFVSMGCGDADACPMRLRDDMEDWELTDPKGKTFEEVAAIRDEVKSRVETLIEALLNRGDRLAEHWNRALAHPEQRRRLES